MLAAYRTHHSGRGDRLVHNILLRKKISQDLLVRAHDFRWGWWTGTMAMGIALLRIVDPKLSSKAMDDYAMAYLPIAPIEILLITFVPILFVNGLGVWLLLACLVLSLLILLLAWKMGWWITRS